MLCEGGNYPPDNLCRPQFTLKIDKKYLTGSIQIIAGVTVYLSDVKRWRAIYFVLSPYGLLLGVTKLNNHGRQITIFHCPTFLLLRISFTIYLPNFVVTCNLPFSLNEKTLVGSATFCYFF